MRKCAKCGKEVADDYICCHICGEKIEDINLTEDETSDDKINDNKDNRKKRIFALCLIGMVLVCLVGLCLILNATIDMGIFSKYEQKVTGAATETPTEYANDTSIKSTNEHVIIKNSNKIVTFDITIDEFKDKYNQLYNKSSENQDAMKRELDFIVNDEVFNIYTEPGVVNRSQKLSDNLIVGCLYDYREDDQQMLRNVLIKVKNDKSEYENIIRLYKNVISILMPDYNSDKIEVITSNVLVPALQENIVQTTCYVDNVKYVSNSYAGDNNYIFLNIVATAGKDFEIEVKKHKTTQATDEEIALAEAALMERRFGSSFGTTSEYAAIYYYLDNVWLNASVDYYGNITLQYIGDFYGVESDVVYEYDPEYDILVFVKSSLDWEWMEMTYGTGNL